MAELIQIVDLIQGEDKNIVVRILDKKTRDPYDVSAATFITAAFPAVGGSVKKTLNNGVTITNGTLGKITIALSEEDTALMTVEDRQSFEVTIDIGSTRKVVQFKKALNVVKKLFT